MDAKFSPKGAFTISGDVLPQELWREVTKAGNQTIATDRVPAVWNGAAVTVQVLVYGKPEQLKKAAAKTA